MADLKVLTGLSASAGVAVSGSAGLNVQQGGITVSSGGLTVSGSTNTSGSLTVGGNGTLSASVATIDSLTVGSSLIVNGTLTTVNTTNLEITDKKIIIASGSTVPSDINGAGLFFGGTDQNGGGAVTSLTFVSSSDTQHELRSADWLGTAADKGVKIGGLEALATIDLGPGGTGFAITSGSTGNYVAVTDNGAAMSGSNVNIKGATVSLGPSVLGGDAEVEIQSENVYIRPNLQITGSGKTFTNLTVTSYDSGFVNVVEAIKELDTAINAMSGESVSPTEYYNVRTVVSGTKQSGDSTIVFTLSGSVQGQNGRTPNGSTITGLSASTPAALIQKLGGMSFDVAVRDMTSNLWSNDLVSVQLSASALSNNFYWPMITVDAPAATTGAEIRLIAVNETADVIV